MDVGIHYTILYNITSFSMFKKKYDLQKTTSFEHTTTKLVGFSKDNIFGLLTTKINRTIYNCLKKLVKTFQLVH